MINQPGSALVRSDYRRLALAHIDGLTTDHDDQLLADNEREWVYALRHLIADTETVLERIRSDVHGPERGLAIQDFEAHLQDLQSALAELVGPPEEPAGQAQPDEEDDEDDDTSEPAGVTGLQLTWERGDVVVWAGGNEADTADEDELRSRLDDIGAGTVPWSAHPGMPLPDGTHAAAFVATMKDCLGWLVSMRSSHDDDRVGASLTWMALAAGLAVRLCAQGRMVPQLRKDSSSGGRGGGGRSDYQVHWVPALINSDEFQTLSKSMPGAVMGLSKSNDRRQFTEDVLGGVVDAICTDAAERVEVPAPPPKPRSATEVAETILALMNGRIFDAPTQRGNELSKGLATWARGVTGTSKATLIIELDEPDESDAWYVRTVISSSGGKLEPVDAAMSNASQNRREQIKAELDRLEGIYEPLLRGKAERRGEVILSQDEAWELMTEAGSVLSAAGFDVRVPPLSRKKPRPGLKLTATDSNETAVGAQQLTYVQWSAVFGDVELTAADIMRLSQEARPLVQSRGRWVELDKADLEAAAEALAERADQTQMSGAEMLRHAMGLEGTVLQGGVAVEGDSWAADLLRSAQDIPEHPPTSPDGFNGELRSYQADALAWLAFLHDAGLGGILALDMGLGKTPTLLAHLATTKRPRDEGGGPSLVIAPPAVVGNWASEAQSFTPGLTVQVHHGPNRAGIRELRSQLETTDVLITTYGTGMRDIDMLEEFAWDMVVLDEGQAIKNPASETAQQLRRLDAHSRIILTGTPIENGLGDLWALLDFTNPGLIGERSTFIAQLSNTSDGRSSAEEALRTLNGVMVYRRTKAEPSIAAELPDRIDTLDRCAMTPEQIGLYQAVLDNLMQETADDGLDRPKKKGAVLAAITALKQICNHPAAYRDGDDGPLEGRSGKLARLNEIVDNVFEADERVLIFTHFAQWGEKMATYLTKRTGQQIDCYHGGLARGARDKMIERFQNGSGKGALVLSLKAGGTGLNLTAASHVVLYDRWWNPAVEDQARDRAWRIGQTKTVVAHRLVCPGTVDERVLIFTHFAQWGEKMATYLTERTGEQIDCYHGGLARGTRDKMIERFQSGTGKGALVLSLKAGGTGLNLTAASHVVLYDRWWNPAVEDQARDRAWRIGQTKTVVAHRLVCPGTVDERVEEVVAGKRQIADLALPKSSSVGDLDADQLQKALGIDPDALLTDDSDEETSRELVSA